MVQFLGYTSDDWTTAGNWNPARIPGSSDYACIPSTSAQSVAISTGTNVVKGVNSQGPGLSVTGGNLELTDATQASAITALSLFGSTMKVDTGASLSLGGSSSWAGGDSDNRSRFGVGNKQDTDRPEGKLTDGFEFELPFLHAGQPVGGFGVHGEVGDYRKKQNERKTDHIHNGEPSLECLGKTVADAEQVSMAFGLQ